MYIVKPPGFLILLSASCVISTGGRNPSLAESNHKWSLESHPRFLATLEMTTVRNSIEEQKILSVRKSRQHPSRRARDDSMSFYPIFCMNLVDKTALVDLL